MSQAPSGPPAPSATPRAHTIWQHTWLFLAAFYVLGVLFGLTAVRSAESEGARRTDLLLQVSLAVCLGWWAIVDARHRRHPIPTLARPWFFLLAGLLVPGYVIWSRGWRGVGWVVVHTVLWCAVVCGAAVLLGLALYGEQWLVGS